MARQYRRPPPRVDDDSRTGLVVEAAFVLSLAVRAAWPVPPDRVRRALAGFLSPGELRMVTKAEPGDLNPASGGWGAMARDLGVRQPDRAAREAVVAAVAATE